MMLSMWTEEQWEGDVKISGEKDDDPRGHLLSRVFGEHEEKAIDFLQQGNVFTPYF